MSIGPVKRLQDAAAKAETMFRNFAGEDPGACLTAGSEHAEACEMADELRDANAAINNWREFLNNCARPGDVANVILERDRLREALRQCITEDHAPGMQEGLGRRKRRLEAINTIARDALGMTCKLCGQPKPEGQSCICFDNNCQ